MAGVRIARETRQHQQAYEVYRDMGPSRTLSGVAAQLGVSPTSVQRWSKSFDWPRRAKTYDADVARKTVDIAEKQGVETEAKARARNLKLVQMGLMKLAQALASGDVRFQLSDLDRLLKLEALINGQASGEGGGGAPLVPEDAGLAEKSAEELWQLIDDEVAAIRRISEWDETVADWVASGRVRPVHDINRRGVCAGCGREFDDDADVYAGGASGDDEGPDGHDDDADDGGDDEGDDDDDDDQVDAEADR